MRKIIVFIYFLLFAVSCKTIDEDWLTPQWILDKIEILQEDCYYNGTTIKSYVVDSVAYVDIYIPNDLWPIENVYYEDGRQVISEDDSTFTYTYFKNNRGDAIETIWEFPDDSGCTD